MTSQAASTLGIDVVIADPSADSPAARVSAHQVLMPAGWDDPIGQSELARRVRTVTLESEFVPAEALEHLEARGVRVMPGSACVRVVQDKLWQKQALARAELPLPAFRGVESPEDVLAASAELGWPLMLKARRNGYDGRGNVLLKGPEEVIEAFSRLGWPGRQLYVEAFVPFERELAVMVVRGLDGASVTYPVVETRQDPALHICREVESPADVPAEVAQRAAEVARGAVEAVDGVGAFGVELFVSEKGAVTINELAPRPHNSGHYSIEGCQTSQFLNHVRAVLGLPLGSPELVAPCVVMVNLLGSGSTAYASPAEMARALAQPRTYVHLYGKAESRPGRKMGHVTSLAATREEALEHARAAARSLPL